MKIYDISIGNTIQNQPYFLGSGRNVSRGDLETDSFLEKMKYRQRGQMWFETDYNMDKDTTTFAKLSKNEIDIFLKNLKFQTFADSIVTRTVDECFGRITTNVALEKWWKVHAFMEDIHSDSYAHIIKALPLDSQKEFDEIIFNKHINKRANDILKHFDRLNNANDAYAVGTIASNEHKKAILKGLVALNILEGCLFKSSFITTFAFSEIGSMITSGKIVAKISQDEDIHYIVTVYLLNQLKKDKEYRDIYEDIKLDIIEMFRTAQSIDIEWIEYVFKDGLSIGSLSKHSLSEYIKYNTDECLRRLGLPFINGGQYKNNLKWVSKYINLGAVQTALNEIDGSNYLLGIVNRNLT